MASLLSALETRLSQDFARYHVRAQVTRLVVGVASAFALQLATGTANLGWKAALATLFGIVVTTARQIWPTLPWNLVTDHLHAAQAAENTVPTGMAANPPTAPSGPSVPSGPAPGA